MSILFESILAFAIVGMSVMGTIRGKFADRQRAEEAKQLSRRERWVAALVRGDPEEIDAVAIELGLGPDDVEADLARIVARRELGRLAAKVPEAIRLRDESDERTRIARQARDEAEAELNRVLAVERDARHFPAQDVERGGQAAAKLMATSPAVVSARAALRAIEEPAGQIHRRRSGIELAIHEAKQRIEEIKHVGSLESQQAEVRCRDAIAAHKQQLKDDARQLEVLDKQIATAREAVADAESKAIERAIAGELPAPPVAEEPTGHGVRDMTPGLR